MGKAFDILKRRLKMNKRTSFLWFILTGALVIAIISLMGVCDTLIGNHESYGEVAEKEFKVTEETKEEFKLITIKELIEKEIENYQAAKQQEESENMARLADMKRTMERLKEREMASSKEMPSRGSSSRRINNVFTVTAYDLSVESCGKGLDHPAYGLTASGESIKGMTREEAMTVAADTKVIPMGSKIRLEFLDENYQQFNGIYTVRDRGGAIKGDKLDLFMGDFKKEKADQSVWDFGKVQARVYLITD